MWVAEEELAANVLASFLAENFRPQQFHFLNSSKQQPRKTIIAEMKVEEENKSKEKPEKEMETSTTCLLEQKKDALMTEEEEKKRFPRSVFFIIGNEFCER